MSTRSTLYTVILGFAVLIASWYLSSMYTNRDLRTVSKKASQVDNQQIVNNENDTTSIIANDFNRIPDDSILNKQSEYLDQNMNNF